MKRANTHTHTHGKRQQNLRLTVTSVKLSLKGDNHFFKHNLEYFVIPEE